MQKSHVSMDPNSQEFLSLLQHQEQMKKNKVPGVKSVLIVLSSFGMVYDLESLRQKVLQTYPEATVFFRTTSGNAIGAEMKQPVDLLIDFTGPKQRQPWFYSRKLRRQARVAVGRNAGFFRKSIFDKLFDEKAVPKSGVPKLPTDRLEKERAVQKQVLGLVGITITQAGDLLKDEAKTIALELPPLAAK